VRLLSVDKEISPEWKFKLPFFYFKGKMFCYLWYHKKYKQPFNGIIVGNKNRSFWLDNGRMQTNKNLFIRSRRIL